MKPKKSYKISILTIIILFSLVSTSSYLSNSMISNFENSSQKSFENFDKLKQSNQWTLPNIYITNWTIANMTYEWCNYKNGYYIIENVSITGVGGINGIHIENTTENFIIRNCQVNEGITLWGVKSGKLINNSILFGLAYPTGGTDQIGIYMKNCSRITIRDNFINDTYNGNYNKIHGFWMYDCTNITIVDNLLSTISSSYLRYSQGFTVQEFQGNKNIEMINNTIQKFDIGIYVTYFLAGCRIIDNQIYNSRIGLAVNGNYHVISSNTIKNCSQWGVSLGCSNSILFGNIISESEIGVRASNANYNVIESNSIQDVSERGMYFISSDYNNITNNIIQKVGEVGIYLDTCNYTIVNGNYISYNMLCIVEIDCFSNIISDNVCIEIPGIIPGYYPLLMVCILIVTVFLFIKFKLKKHY